MKNIGNIIKTLQNIMRKDQGVSGDAQRIEQLGWLITLKIIDDKDTELELIQDNYISPIPSELQWRNWAADSEGITGDELKAWLRHAFEEDLPMSLSEQFTILKEIGFSNIKLLWLYNNQALHIAYKYFRPDLQD